MGIVVSKSAFDLYTSSAERETATVYHLQMVTAMQSQALAGSLWDYNVAHVTTILDGLAQEKSFVHATVIDTKGKVVARDTAKAGAADADTGAAAQHVWSIDAPSVFEEGA